MTDDLANQLVSACETGIDLHTNADETAGHGVHEVVVLGLERDDLGLDLAPLDGTSALVLGDETRADRDEIAHLEHALQNCATSDTANNLLRISSRPVVVEGPNDDHLWRRNEVPHRYGNAAQIIDDDVDVVASLGRDGDDGRAVSHRSLDELLDVVLLLDAQVLVLDNDVNLVLQYDNLVQVHDLHSSQMLRRLWLRACLVSRHQKQCRVHDGRSRKHGCHEHIVTRAVDERHVSHQKHLGLAVRAQHMILLFGRVCGVALGRRAFEALVQLRVGIAKLDGDVALFLFLVFNGLNN